jgi:hypothetical protein
LRSYLRLEVLEDRRLPTTFTPTTFADGGSGSGSLRDTILQADADPGTSPDTIQLMAGTYSLTILNTNGQENQGLTGDLDITSTAHTLTIQGTGTSGTSASIIDASQLQDRAFQIVNPGTTVVFQNLVIRGGLAQDNGIADTQPGTNDALGGGILNNGGNVTLTTVVLQSNAAKGGPGANGKNGRNGQPGQTGHSALGGGLYSSAGNVTVSGGQIVSNQLTAGKGGKGGNGTKFSGLPGVGGSGGNAQGAGLYVANGTLSLMGANVAGNLATAGAGGQSGSPGPDFTVGFTGAVGGAGGNALGGGLFYLAGTVTISHTSLSRNSLKAGAGGVGGVGGVASTVGGNGGVGGPGGSALGGGLFTESGTLSLSNAILSNNSLIGGTGGTGGAGAGAPVFSQTGGAGGTGGLGGMAQGGGLYSSGGTVTLTSDMVAANVLKGGTGGAGGHGHGGILTGGAGGAGGAGGTGQGGAVFTQSTLTSSGGQFMNNEVVGGKGGVGGTGGNGEGTSKQTTVAGVGGAGGTGGAAQGAGFFAAGGMLSVSGAKVAGNHATGGSGGLGGTGGNGFVFFFTISGHGGAGGVGGLAEGGGVFGTADAAAMLTKTAVTANVLLGGTGGAGGAGGKFLTGSGIGGNGGGGGAASGGGIYTTGALSLDLGSITKNSATGGNGGPGHGIGTPGPGGTGTNGGLFASGSFTLSGTTIANNQQANGNPGGVAAPLGDGRLLAEWNDAVLAEWDRDHHLG